MFLGISISLIAKVWLPSIVFHPFSHIKLSIKLPSFVFNVQKSAFGGSPLVFGLADFGALGFIFNVKKLGFGCSLFVFGLAVFGFLVFFFNVVSPTLKDNAKNTSGMESISF